MQTVRTIIWVVFAVLLTLLASQNLERVPVWVFPGWIAETPLALVIMSSFLLGFLPPYLVNKSNSWRLQRKIRQQDETIAMLRPTPVPAAAAGSTTATTPLDPTA